MKKRIVAAVLAMISAAAPAAPPAVKGSGSQDAEHGETSEALTLTGDRRRGAEAYEVCAACHLPSGAGRRDGTFAQLAGQHSTVLIKQLADIRSGLRDSPTMRPFAATLIDAQALADVAAYIESRCIPPDNGRYDSKPGNAARDWQAPADTAQQLARGQALYEKDCATCHGVHGEGNKDQFYPVLAGQHYKYLLRQMTEIRDGKRGNASAPMVKLIARYDDPQLVAVSAYQASLVMPGTKCAATSAATRKKAAP